MVHDEKVRQIYSAWCREGGGLVTNVPTWCNDASTFVEVIGGERLGGWLWRVTDWVADDPVVDVSKEAFASFAAAQEAATSQARAMEQHALTHRAGDSAITPS